LEALAAQGTFDVREMTQGRAASRSVDRLLLVFPLLSQISETLSRVLDLASNTPPGGKADGTMSETQFRQVSSTSKALKAVLISLLFHPRL
jgi:hypothetical protein